MQKEEQEAEEVAAEREKAASSESPQPAMPPLTRSPGTQRRSSTWRERRQAAGHRAGSPRSNSLPLGLLAARAVVLLKLGGGGGARKMERLAGCRAKQRGSLDAAFWCAALWSGAVRSHQRNHVGALTPPPPPGTGCVPSATHHRCFYS